MNSGIYQIKNCVNGKVYVGSTRDLCARKSEHWSRLRNNSHANKHLQSAWNKYEETVFEFVVLEKCDMNQLLMQERHWIIELMACDRCHGYNHESDPTDKTKSSEHKAKISESLKRKYRNGFRHPNLGKSWSVEIKQKMSASQKGKKLTEKHKSNIARGQHKAVDQFDKDGNLLASFSSIMEAALVLGIAAPNITMVCNGKRRHTHGFVFKHKVSA